MTNRIIRVAAALAGCILLAAGCIQRGALVPDPDAQQIRFRGGSSLLRDDALTKGTTESFISSSDDFVVFGEKVNAQDAHLTVVDGITVHHTYEESQGVVTTDEWTYSPPCFWSWTSPSDRHDFVAVSPAGQGTVKEQTVGNLSVVTRYSYDAASGVPDTYDILAATYRRNGNDWERRYNRVDLSFSHMGSAVGVRVINNSSSRSVRVDAIYYKNLVVSADAKVSLDNYGRPALRWANLTPSALAVRQLTPGETVVPQGQHAGEYQIMIPQNLTLYNPTLCLRYTVNGNTFEEQIPLNGIQRADGTPISAWESGVKYTYSISMRLDGGLLVTVSAIPWDEPVQGETPGILI